jgi:hypothetical protein
MTLALDAFNLLNRVNYGSYVGTLGSPLVRRAGHGPRSAAAAGLGAGQVLIDRVNSLRFILGALD